MLDSFARCAKEYNSLFSYLCASLRALWLNLKSFLKQ